MAKIAIIGGGGLAKEIIECIELNNDEVYGIFALESELDYPYLGYLDELVEYKHKFDGVIIAIGAVNKKGIEQRKKIINFLKQNNIPLISVISPFAKIGKGCTIGEGVYIGHDVIISVDSKILDNIIINQKAVIGHDTLIKENTSIAPLVFIGGNCKIEENVMIGVGATIKEGLTIEKDSVIGMRSIVVKNIKSNSLVLPVLSKIYKD